MRVAIIVVGPVLVLTSFSSACGGDRASAPDPVTTPAHIDSLGLDVLRPLLLETYEGSGQTVHPDFLSLGAGTALRGDFLAITPYPFGDATYENPVVYRSSDRAKWAVPVPSLNPLISPQRGYLSDPDLVYDPETSEILLYYRQVDRANEIMLVRSADGASWSEPTRVVVAPNHEAISPAIVRRSAHEWLLWSVNGRGGCAGAMTTVELRRSEDGTTWSGPETIALDQPGFSPWHVEVQWIPSREEYWALYNVKTLESCSTPALFLATSRDGVTWKTYPGPVMARGEVLELYDIVYRSTFSFDAATGTVTFWYSGARYDGGRYAWHTVSQRRRVTDVFARIKVAPTHGTVSLRAGIPPLTDPP